MEPSTLSAKKGRRAEDRGESVASSSRVKLDDVFPGQAEREAARRVKVRTEDMLATKQRELEGILNHHDDLVREQFHLEKFVSLLYYDPQEAKRDRSDVFQQYAQRYSLLSNASEAGPSRQTRRAQNERISILKAPSEQDLKRASRIDEKAKGGSISANGGTTRKGRPSASSVNEPGTKRKHKGSISDDEAEGKSTSISAARASYIHWKKRGKLKEDHPELLSKDMKPSGKRVSTPTIPSVGFTRYKTVKKRRRSADFSDDDSIANVKERKPITSKRSKTDLNHQNFSLRHTITIPPKSTSFSRPTVAGKTVSSQPSSSQKWSVKRIKLIVNEPPPLISHPAQKLPRPSFGKSLTTFLSSYDIPYDDAPTLSGEALEKQAVRDARLLNKISRLRQEGRLLDFNLGSELGDKSASRSPPDLRPSDIWSAIVQEAIDVSERMRGRPAGKQVTQSIHRKIEAYWTSMASQEAKAKAAEDKRVKQLAKNVSNEVIAEWRKAVYHVAAIEKEKMEAEERRLGRLHLDDILTQSGRILEVQQQELLKGDSRSRSHTGSAMSVDEENETDEYDSEDSDASNAGEEEGSDDGESGDEGEDISGTAALLLGEGKEDRSLREDEAQEQVLVEDDALDETSQMSMRDEATEDRDDHHSDDETDTLGIAKSGTDSLVVGESLTPSSGWDEAASASKDFTPSLEELSGNEILALGHFNHTQFTRSESPIFDSPVIVEPPNHDAVAATESPVPMDVDEPDVHPDYSRIDTSPTRVEESETCKEPEAVRTKQNGVNGAHHENVQNGTPLGENGTVTPRTASPTPRKAVPPSEKQEQETTESGLDKGPLIQDCQEPVNPGKEEAADDVSQDVAEDASKEQENSNEPWEPPPHLKPYAVAEVNYDPSAPIKPPLLLRGTLRPYQQSGLEWLISLHNNNMNGILADEMGLGKTIQTIALLAHLACDRGIWGPHLIIVPTSVILNWEMEFKKFLPGFKVLSYHGSVKRRQELRKGWNNKYAFNVCVTSYSLASRDAAMFKRKPWYYMILDEAHMIKNFKSQRWQILLMFKSFRRLLLTGTPLQNNLTELWALLQFLMSGTNFANLKEFGEWFSNPLEKAIEQGTVMDDEIQQRVTKLHTVLRPYLLRRLKRDVEKELPSKYEHLVLCRLSKRQRFLYDEFMSRSQTREDLQSGVYQKIANILMQLRKVCNHPDLFEVRPIVTSFAMDRSAIADFEIKELLVRRRLLDDADESSRVDLDFLGLQFSHMSNKPAIPASSCRLLEESLDDVIRNSQPGEAPPKDMKTINGYLLYRAHRLATARYERYQQWQYINHTRCSLGPLYGSEMIATVKRLYRPLKPDMEDRRAPLSSPLLLASMIKSYERRAEEMSDIIEKFAFATPRAVARDLPKIALRGLPEGYLDQRDIEFDAVLHHPAVKLQIAFPDLSLLEYDCGKLRELARLLRERKAGGHRVLIFTQMTRILDILEIFLNYHGYLYLRLDGATKIEDRQYITERFNADDRIFAFISSSRSGGVGINLTGADTVIFYDSDFNPQMDRQCEDRAHRIGQIRDVHIYRFISQHTVEEAMLRKANQKRSLDNLVIQQGDFDWKSFFTNMESVHSSSVLQKALMEFEDVEDVRAANEAEKEEALLEDVNQADFGDEGTNAAATGDATPATPVATEPAQEDVRNDAEQEEDDGIGSLADYLVRFVQRDWEYFRGWKVNA